MDLSTSGLAVVSGQLGPSASHSGIQLHPSASWHQLKTSQTPQPTMSGTSPSISSLDTQSWLPLSAGWHQLWEFSAPQSAILGLALLANGPLLALGQWSRKCDLSLPSSKAATGQELPGHADNCVKTLHTFQQPQVSTLGRAWLPTRPGASHAYQYTHSSQSTITGELLEPHWEQPWSRQLWWPVGNMLLGLTGDFISFLKIYLFFYWKIIALQNFSVFCQASTWISHGYTYIPSLLKLPPISLSIPPL